jgi:hypothetical protein
VIADGAIFAQSTIIALVGIIATGLVGVGVATLNSRAESNRLREQFAFQRWETDRQELRSMIDDLAVNLAALPDALDRLGRLVVLQRSISLPARSDSARDLSSRVGNELIELADRQDAAARSVERVRLRLDDNATSCLAIAEAMIERSRQPIRPWTNSSPDDLEPASRETAEQYRAFVTEARKITAAAAIYER